MIDSDLKVYYMMVVLVILLVAAVVNLLRSRVGRAWVAIRDNDISAEVMGINIVQYKLLAFFVAGFIGGIAGAFWISNLAAISPEHFPWFWSLWLVGVILIGGVGSIHGTIFGSIFMVVVMELLQMAVIPLAVQLPQASDGFSLHQGGGLRSGDLCVPDLRAQRSGLPLVADQELFQPVAVFVLAEPLTASVINGQGGYFQHRFFRKEGNMKKSIGRWFWRSRSLFRREPWRRKW